ERCRAAPATARAGRPRRPPRRLPPTRRQSLRRHFQCSSAWPPLVPPARRRCAISTDVGAKCVLSTPAGEFRFDTPFLELPSLLFHLLPLPQVAHRQSFLRAPLVQTAPARPRWLAVLQVRFRSPQAAQVALNRLARATEPSTA